MTVNRNAAVKALPPAFLGLSLVTVLLRCYVRIRVTKAFGWDDGLMIIALVRRLSRANRTAADSRDTTDRDVAILCHVLCVYDYRWRLRDGDTLRSVDCRPPSQGHDGMSVPPPRGLRRTDGSHLVLVAVRDRLLPVLDPLQMLHLHLPRPHYRQAPAPCLSLPYHDAHGGDGPRPNVRAAVSMPTR